MRADNAIAMLFAGMLVALLGLGSIAHAAINPVEFDDPVKEQRYRALLHELRCLVCQNQSLADSDADLAGDLRRQVYTRIQAGESDREITDFLVARYGDFVLYRPPLSPLSLVLWAGPFALFALGAFVMWRIVRRRTGVRPVAPSTTDASERERIRRLLED